MPDEIWGDRAAYTGDRENVWHHIGTYVGDRHFTSSEEVLQLAGMDIEYKMRPFRFYAFEGRKRVPVEFPNFFAITRPRTADDPQDAAPEIPVGRATGAYRIMQPREAFKVFDPLVQAGGLHYSAAGMLGNGERMWISAEIGQGAVRELRDGTPDLVKSYLMFTQGFTGDTGIVLNESRIRAVCANTIRAAIDCGNSVTIVHREGMYENLELAKNELAKASAAFAGALENYRVFAQIKVTRAMLDELYRDTFELETLENISGNRRGQIEAINRKMIGGAGNGGGTLWDWFNGVTEHLDHDGKGGRASNIESSWLGTKGKTRGRAMDAALRVAGLKAA